MYLRVLALIAIVGVHVYGSFLNELNIQYLSRFTCLGVPLFFMISGYFSLIKPISDWWSYYKKRLIRILVPFLLYAMFYTLYFDIIENRNVLSVLWGMNSYFSRIFTANIHGTYWYVYAIMIFYFFAPSLNRLIYGLKNYEFRILYIGLWILLLIINIFMIINSEFNVGSDMLLGCINRGFKWFLECSILFLTGYFIRRENISIGILAKILAVVLSFLLYCMDFPMMKYVVLFCLICKCNYEFKNNKVLYKVVNWFDKQSYSIYLIHAGVLSLLLKLIRNFYLDSFLKMLITYVLTIIVSALVTMIIDKYITEKIIVMTKKYLKI